MDMEEKGNHHLRGRIILLASPLVGLMARLTLDKEGFKVDVKQFPQMENKCIKMVKPHHLSTALASTMHTNTKLTSLANIYHSTCRGKRNWEGWQAPPLQR